MKSISFIPFYMHYPKLLISGRDNNIMYTRNYIGGIEI